MKKLLKQFAIIMCCASLTSLTNCQNKSEDDLMSVDQSKIGFVDKNVIAEKGEMRPKANYNSGVEFYPLSNNSLKEGPAKNKLSRRLRRAVLEIMVVRGPQNMASYPNWEGFEIIPYDLNSGAGGQYLYFVCRRGDVGAPLTMAGVTDVTFRSSSNYVWASTTPDGYIPIYRYYDVAGQMQDLNEGAGGKWIYGSYKTTTGNGFTNIGVIVGTSSGIQPPAGWYKNGTDLNEGAGGKYVYFVWQP